VFGNRLADLNCLNRPPDEDNVCLTQGLYHRVLGRIGAISTGSGKWQAGKSTMQAVIAHRIFGPPNVSREPRAPCGG
jgi:hypothetical protein